MQTEPGFADVDASSEKCDSALLRVELSAGNKGIFICLLRRSGTDSFPKMIPASKVLLADERDSTKPLSSLFVDIERTCQEYVGD
ncbi:hypothetical protein GJ744_009280 [Endocarpon pusillum]|uniref:Uncharacterized protein n=1 Tax=Endocarpon pusillum TaxID=364733 RepID=A0A8H7AIB6_9EURO|nr:hypothetical protein GJ744_009280 [Endocarpon pusillum]